MKGVANFRVQTPLIQALNFKAPAVGVQCTMCTVASKESLNAKHLESKFLIEILAKTYHPLCQSDTLFLEILLRDAPGNAKKKTSLHNLLRLQAGNAFTRSLRCKFHCNKRESPKKP